MDYEILEHTADLRMKARGETLRELFLHAMQGMTEAMKPERAPGATQTARPISVSSSSSENLLIDFLNEALSLGETNQELYRDITFEIFSDKELSGMLLGYPRTAIGREIKAATFHELSIREQDGMYEATIVFDV